LCATLTWVVSPHVRLIFGGCVKPYVGCARVATTTHSLLQASYSSPSYLSSKGDIEFESSSNLPGSAIPPWLHRQDSQPSLPPLWGPQPFSVLINETLKARDRGRQNPESHFDLALRGKRPQEGDGLVASQVRRIGEYHLHEGKTHLLFRVSAGRPDVSVDFSLGPTPLARNDAVRVVYKHLKYNKNIGMKASSILTGSTITRGVKLMLPVQARSGRGREASPGCLTPAGGLRRRSAARSW
jgi:hypothetical protein